MRCRKWSSEEKLAIILESLKGDRSVADLCREHQISQAQFYQWRDRFLEGAKQGLNGHRSNGRNEKDAKIEKLETLIGKQTIVIETLKKNGCDPQTKRLMVQQLCQQGFPVV